LVFTLGSFVVTDAGDFYAAAAEAAARLGRRAVLLVGREAEARLGALATCDVFVAGYAPHSLVFPRAAAVIHHGGIGTVGQALRAGKPQVICPVLGDQFDNAERLVRLGVARRLDLRKFSAKRAEAVLSDLLGDEGAATRASGASEQVATEDGAGVVARRIGELLAGE
jgi:UDP:flavonoid glycosyltransferase YjiC (YdhE family)